MKTIQVSDEQYDFITKLANTMENQDNRGTSFPLFYVHQKVEKYVSADMDYDYTVYVDEDFEGPVDEFEDDRGHMWRYNLSEKMWYSDELEQELTEDEFDESFDTPYKKAYIQAKDEAVLNVGPFLTCEDAEDHIKKNGYHYNEPHVYCWCAWRNWEMQKLMQMMFFLAGKTPAIPYRGELWSEEYQKNHS